MADEKEVQVPEEDQVQDDSSQEAKAAPDGQADSPEAEEASADIAEESGNEEFPDISEGVDPVPEESADADTPSEEASGEDGENPEFSDDEMASMTDEEKAMLMSMDDVPEEAGSSGSNGLLSQEDLDAAMMDAADAENSGTGGLLDSADIPQENEGKFDDYDSGSAASEPQTPVNKAEFQQLSPAAAGDNKPRNIDLLMDVDLPVSIELGRTRMNISDILALSPGSVVELDKLVGEPVDLLVNQKIVARGEVVVVEENFGLRITELISAEERIKNL